MSCGQQPTRKLLHTLLSLNFIAIDDSPKTIETKFYQIFCCCGDNLPIFTISRRSHELVEHCSHLVVSRHCGAHLLTLLTSFWCILIELICDFVTRFGEMNFSEPKMIDGPA
jgi:hypothetical protein